MDFVSVKSLSSGMSQYGADSSNSRLLAQYPEVQQRLRAECMALPSSYKAKDLPTKEELKHMKYLANVIHEGQQSNDRGPALRQNN